MRITHCIYNFDSGGGAENLLIDILNKMCLLNDLQLIVVNNIYDTEMLGRIDKRVKIITLNRIPGSRTLLPIIKLNLELIKFKPQIVHCHNYTIPSLIFPLPNLKLFYTIHDLNIPMKYSSRMKCMFAISDAVKEDAERRTKHKIITIPNGIKVEDVVEKRVFNYEYPFPFKIVNVARLQHEKKGQDILINAVAKLKEEGLIVNVDFIGNGPSYDYLQEMVNINNLNNQIRFLGLKDRNYVHKHLCEYDLMCHPARYEGFGLTVAEGMAANLPLLVSNDGGPFELIERGHLGAKFKMGDFKDCAAAIKDIMFNYSKYVSLVSDARTKVLKTYSLDAMVCKYIEEYKHAQ